MSEKVKKGCGEHGLPMTTGRFKVRGFVIKPTDDEKFYKVSTQKNGFERHTINFGVQTSPSNEIYVQISDSEKEDAYFYKKPEAKGEKGETKKISWGQRKNFKEDGFDAIGVTIGLEKNAENKNVKFNMTDYDSAEYLYGKLENNMPVMVVGDIDYNSMDTEDGKRRFKKFNIKQIFNSKLDFDKEDFLEENSFKQKCLFMDIEQAKKDGVADKDDPRWIVKAKIVTYKGLEDVEFVLRNKTLAGNFKKNLKPYNCIMVHGRINNQRMEVEVESSGDDWGGEADPFTIVNNPRKFEFEIKGIDTKDIDTKTYTEKIVLDAFKADEEFGGEEELPWNEDSSDDDDVEW